MKKSLVYFLVIAIIMSLLSGCNFNRISLEEDIINMQMGGYLYTSQVRADTKDERAFLKARSKAVDEMIDLMEKTAKSSFDVTDGLEKYEDNLLAYIGKIENPSIADSQVINSIIEKIFAYKITLDSYEEEIRQYMKMKPDGDANKAIINTYLFNAVCKSVTYQNEYISWLVNNTASVSVILEATSERQSNKLIDSVVTVYAKKIKNSFIDMLVSYDAASTLNSTILSADYYVSSAYLEKAIKNIELLKSGKANVTFSAEDLVELEQMLNEAQKSIKKPPVLKPLPDAKTSFSFTRKVYAKTDDTSKFNLSVALLEFYFNPVPWIIMAEETEDITKKLETKKAEIKSAPKKMYKTAQEKPASQVNLTADGKSASEIAEEEAKKRAEMIGAIMIGQGIVKFQTLISGGNFQASYEKIIEQISTMLVKNGSKLSDKDRQTAMDLIKTNMEELLGGNKEQFVNLILESEAADLYGQFQDWKDSIENIKTHEFSKEDLMNLLITIGVGISQETIDNVTAEKPTNSTQPTTSPTPVSPNMEATPVPSAPAYNPDSSEVWTPRRDPLGLYDVFHINAPHYLFKDIDIFSDNASLLFAIYGWVDPLNYSNYQRIETVKMDESLLAEIYLDTDKDRVGWALRMGENDFLTYSYHFPGEKNKTLEIKRIGTQDKSFVHSIYSEDESIDRYTSIYFNKPDEADVFEAVSGLFEKQDGNKVGLNLLGSSSYYTYDYRDNDRLMDSFQYNSGVLIKEIHNDYSGDGKNTNEKSYFDSGILMYENNLLNDSPEGIQKYYYENTFMQTITEYKDGKRNGTEKRYFENRMLSVLETYVMGVRDGPYEKYYGGDTQQLRIKGTYTQGLESGVWYVYNEDGSLQKEISY